MRPSNGSGTVRVLLLVEDNIADADLTIELLQEAGVGADIRVVRDGDEAMAFLRRQVPYEDERRPHLVLLDLNLPRKDGRRVLEEIKGDPRLRQIPVVVLTTSKAEIDVMHCYRHHANSYLVKPRALSDFTQMIESVKTFWLRTATLPDPDWPVG